MKEQTPLGMAISVVKGHEEYLVTKSSMVSLLESLLPEERKVIEVAHNDATENYRKGYPTPILDGAVYFETKFKQ